MERTNGEHHDDKVLFLDVDLCDRLGIVKHLTCKARKNTSKQSERAEPGRVTRSWQRVEGRTGVDELADGLSEGVDLLLDLSNLRAETPQRTRFSQTFGREANQG